MRGNVDTRIRKLLAEEFDALVLATAGVKRCGLFDGSYMSPIETDLLLPSAGQGCWCCNAGPTMPKPWSFCG